MFESNFPVDRSSTSYCITWNAFKRVASGFSPWERDQLFFGTAAQVYGLEPDMTGIGGRDRAKASRYWALRMPPAGTA